MGDKNLSPEALSERWNGIPLTTLSRWRWTGTGPIFMKFGKHVSYKLKDIEAFEEEQRRRDTTCPGIKEKNEAHKMMKQT